MYLVNSIFSSCVYIYRSGGIDASTIPKREMTALCTRSAYIQSQELRVCTYGNGAKLRRLVLPGGIS